MTTAIKFLSTPSARRATRSFIARKHGGKCKISIHALREEGDAYQCRRRAGHAHFYPRPPRGGRLETLRELILEEQYFYPRPPRGGRLAGQRSCPPATYFYPRPPRGGRPKSALLFILSSYFYPRPPRGGRRGLAFRPPRGGKFLSTPSARRATR